MDISSFTSASTLPKKILINTDIIKDVKKHNIRPTHVQLNPTNKCPLKCTFCSCKNRKIGAVMELNKAKELISSFYEKGTKAITITGGGEPLAYPYLDALIEYINKIGIDIGLVTNGILFNKISLESIKKLTWCRISVSDEQVLPQKILDNVIKCEIDWSFSYVLNSFHENIMNLVNCVHYANLHKFTHVRLVDNILSMQTDVTHQTNMIKHLFNIKHIDDKLVIYQGRKTYTKGHKRCFISLLKPNIDPEGHMLPCCIDENEPVMIEQNNNIMNLCIKELKIGDKCIPYGEIEQIFKKPKEKLLEIELETGRTIRVSKDHTLITIDDIFIQGSNNKRTHNKQVSRYKMIEKSANSVKIGDIIPCKFKINNYEHDKSLNECIARFLGYYVSEGWTTEKDKCIGLAPGKDEKFINEIIETIKELNTQYKLSYKIYNRRTTKQFVIYSEDLYNLIINSGCGKKSNQKGIPYTILNSPTNIKKAFLKGYFDGDGHSSVPRKDYNGYKMGFTTVSRKLASDLMIILSQLNVYATVHNDRRAGEMIIENRKVLIRDRYIIKVSGHYNLKKLDNVIDIKSKKLTRNQQRAISFYKDEDLMFLKIKYIREIEPSGEYLYDIKVKNGNKFCTGIGQVIVHNCGIQYAAKHPSLSFDKNAIMNKNETIDDIYHNQHYFDGSNCDKCYYSDYNDILNMLWDGNETQHKTFI